MPTKRTSENCLARLLSDELPKDFKKFLDCAESSKDEFNLFTAITSNYWEENLHSNLIKAILDCNELGTIEVVSNFLDCIGCSDFKNGVWDRTAPIVDRESSTASDEGNGRVDVLLRFNEGKASECVVIIENKINGAQETENQLEKYLKNFKEENILKVVEYYELLEHCLGSLEQVKSKGWSRTESAPIF